MHLDELFNAGKVPTITVGDPGTHGAAVTGMQGIGVSTPRAAAVAAATIGLAIDWHIPNGSILSIGLLSMILAKGMAVVTLFIGSTIKALGATPKLHFRLAPPHTSCPIYNSFFATFFSSILLLITSYSNKYTTKSISLLYMRLKLINYKHKPYIL
jgi:hypothetical protein